MAKKKAKKNAPPDDFDKLVVNAIDFFNKSIDEFQAKAFKYSVIHFCSAIELFLKSRLMLEHWALILEKPEKADLAGFQKGKFTSVSMETAVERLNNVAGESIASEHVENFNRIRDNRNRLVHFHSVEYATPKDDELQEQIAIEQCKAWYSLSHLVGHLWSEQFKNYRGPIEALNKRMHDVRAFLKVKYDRLKPEIAAKKEKGLQFSACEACSYPACEITPVLEPLFSSKCLVCNASDRYLYVDCPNEECEKKLVIEDGFGENHCQTCGTSISIDQLADIVDPDGAYPSKDDPTPTRFHCADCESYEESVIQIEGEYVCVGCLAKHSDLEECDYCSAYIAGFDSEGSGLYGCTICDGRDFDKD